MNQLIEQKFLALFEQQWGKKADRTEMLPASGSARKYWRIYWNGESCIAAWNRNVEENRLFIDFSRHFAEKAKTVQLTPADFHASTQTRHQNTAIRVEHRFEQRHHRYFTAHRGEGRDG